ncbi:MAG: hypothetical protein PHE68_05025 [Candidatus Peribacteraceae bacterium]|nr:hypothetical protein [Candidatus Peribacteraceae bacterium]MDD5074878.1 hypothetical protein [Candidatus Peribacteraceae bacterium]
MSSENCSGDCSHCGGVRLEIPPDHDYAAVPLRAGVAFAERSGMDSEVIDPDSIYPQFRQSEKEEQIQRVTQVAGSLGYRVFQCVNGGKRGAHA